MDAMHGRDGWMDGWYQRLPADSIIYSMLQDQVTVTAKSKPWGGGKDPQKKKKKTEKNERCGERERGMHDALQLLAPRLLDPCR